MRVTPREVFRTLKKNFSLNPVQTSVLIGTMLGDGTIQARKTDARLHIKHSLNQLSLVEYKRQVFSNITCMPVRVFKQKVGEKDYNFAEFVTLIHPEFSKFYRLFYPKGKKVVPKNIGEDLNTLSLAVWIMDDGSSEYAGLSIQTHSFEEKDVGTLMKAIKENFGIETIKRMNKGRWVIYFPKASLPKLIETVGKHILPKFKYKFEPYYLRRPRRDCTPDPVKTGYDTVRTA